MEERASSQVVLMCRSTNQEVSIHRRCIVGVRAEREIAAVLPVDHPHLVNLLGIDQVMEEDGRIVAYDFVYERPAGGNLLDYLL